MGLVCGVKLMRGQCSGEKMLCKEGQGGEARGTFSRKRCQMIDRLRALIALVDEKEQTISISIPAHAKTRYKRTDNALSKAKDTCRTCSTDRKADISISSARTGI